MNGWYAESVPFACHVCPKRDDMGWDKRMILGDGRRLSRPGDRRRKPIRYFTLLTRQHPAVDLKRESI